MKQPLFTIQIYDISIRSPNLSLDLIYWRRYFSPLISCPADNLRLDALYQDCQKDGFTSVIEKLRKGKEESDLSKKSDTLEHANDYQITKEKLILRPLNYKNNRNILKRHIYRRIGDIVLLLP